MNKDQIEFMIIGIFIGIILAIGFVQLEISPQWVTNQTLINQTQIAFDYGYGTATYEITNLTIESKLLPVYNRTNNTIEYIGYYNLTKCIGGK